MVELLTVHSKHVLGIVPLGAKLGCGEFAKDIRKLSLDSGRSVGCLDLPLLDETDKFFELLAVLSKWWWFWCSG